MPSAVNGIIGFSNKTCAAKFELVTGVIVSKQRVLKKDEITVTFVSETVERTFCHGGSTNGLAWHM